MNWKQSASSISWNIRPFIAGDYRRSATSIVFENVNPASEETLCEVAVGDAAEVDEAVRVARERFNDGCWSGLQPGERAEVLLKLADLVVLNKARLALLDSLEMGKPITAALYDAEVFAPTLLRSCAGFADKVLGQSAPICSQTISFNTYEPKGVIGAITPWNFPSVNAVIKFAPALAAGNSVVLKPSELSSSSALILAELALEAGLPEGVLNIVPGLGATVGAALALHVDVDLLSFTGSTATGRRIMELAGRSNGKPLLLECGGKSPQVVFDDAADLDAVAQATVRSVLWNQGQVCSAHTRLIVHADVKEQLLEKVISLARGYVPGDPLEADTVFGPLASPAQRDKVKGHIERACKAGARAALLGAVSDSGGCFVSPTIFDDVDASLPLVREEIFGPVLCLQKFRTEAEALSLANGTEYGLAATVWTRDLGRAKRMAHSIKAGTVSVRTSGAEGTGSGCRLSHEPQKASGFGSELGIRGLQSYSTLKLVQLIGA